MAQCHQPMRHCQLITNPKGGHQLGLLHVQRLPEVRNMCPANAKTVNLKIHVHVIERLENIAHSSPLVVVIYPVEYYILDLHRLR